MSWDVFLCSLFCGRVCIRMVLFLLYIFGRIYQQGHVDMELLCGKFLNFTFNVFNRCRTIQDYTRLYRTKQFSIPSWISFGSLCPLKRVSMPKKLQLRWNITVFHLSCRVYWHRNVIILPSFLFNIFKTRNDVLPLFLILELMPSVFKKISLIRCLSTSLIFIRVLHCI